MHTTIRHTAAHEIDAGNVELGWYMHGVADRAEGLEIDPHQAFDAEYGVHYRNGYHGRAFNE